MGWDEKDEIKHIEKLIKKERDPQVRDRLRGVLLLKKGYTQGKVAEIMDVTTRTVYNWKTRYNQEGVEGLMNKPIPGRKTTLDEKDMKRLRMLLEERDYWSSNQVRALIKEEFGVEFTTRHIPRILRKLGLRYQKPFVNDYRRPMDAEGILKKDYWRPRWTMRQ
ncbi:MAG TPA: IS630 family transposase [Thermoplasmatales archaeon]|nr:IS630 family transposase [Thermoplasmatales archaeon]